MNIEKIVNEFIKNPIQENCIKLLEWCYKNEVDFNDKNIIYAFHMSTKYLFKCKIGKFNEDDCKVIIKYLSNRYAHSVKLKQAIEIKILDEEEYKKTDKKQFTKSIGICISYGQFNKIYYSPDIIKMLMSNDINQFFNSIKTIYHEVVHAVQNNIINANGLLHNEVEYSKQLYIIAAERIVRIADKKFYENNYDNIFVEAQAELIGIQKAKSTLEEFNKKIIELCDLDKINKLMEEYKNKVDSNIKIFNIEAKHMKVIDPVLCLYVKNHLNCLEDYPILKIAFNNDGTKKDIIQLINERREKLKNCNDIERLNDLYLTVCNDKNSLVGGLKGTTDEIKKLYNYLLTNDYDKFEYELFVYRLNKANLTDEKKEEILSSIKKDTNIDEKKIS